MSDGKSFHVHAPATGKVRRPDAGINILPVVEDRSLCRAGLYFVKWWGLTLPEQEMADPIMNS